MANGYAFRFVSTKIGKVQVSMKNTFCVFMKLCIFWCFVYSECPVIVPRDEWGAVPPLNEETLKQPIDLVIIQHTVYGTCNTDEACAKIAREIQEFHIFLVGGNGKVYECRGWNYIGAHTYGYNYDSYGISFIGNFNVDTPTDKMIEAAKNLIQCGVDAGHIGEDYYVVGHRQLTPTESPGEKLYHEIQSWPRYLADASSIAKNLTIF